MDNKSRPSDDDQNKASTDQASHEKVKNPFENNQSVEQDMEQSQEDMNKEQQFKEATTERD